MHYIPYILLFAAAAAVIYAWGLWRSMRQQQDLSNLLSAKGVAKIKMCIRDSLQDMEDFTEMNEVYQEFFTEPYPARAAFQVAKLPKGAKVEIEAVAK